MSEQSTTPTPAVTDPPTDVPADETPAATCDHCGRPFRTERARDLHVGVVHAGECTDAERAAHEDAREDEREDLFLFHLKVMVVLGVTYAVTILFYMIALGSGWL